MVRDTILGPRGPSRVARGARDSSLPKRHAGDEVEILEAEIQDNVIAELMKNVQRESVMLAIGDQAGAREGRLGKLRSELERQQTELQMAGKQREAQLSELVRKLKHEAELANPGARRELVQGEQVRPRRGASWSSCAARSSARAVWGALSWKRDCAPIPDRAGAGATWYRRKRSSTWVACARSESSSSSQARAVVAERASVQPQLSKRSLRLATRTCSEGRRQHEPGLAVPRQRGGRILRTWSGSRFLPR